MATPMRRGATNQGPAPLTERKAWKALGSHYDTVRGLHLRNLFANDPARGERMAAEAVGLFLDYSKNRITDETLNLLVGLAEESGLRQRIDAMFRGEKINTTEKRAVLHVALRAPRGTSIVLDGENVVPQVQSVLDKMAAFAKRVRSGQWKGHSGKRVRNVINIGIGGSDLGPVMAYEALKHYSDRALTFRFVSNIDGTDFAEAVADLDPSETLFILSSKTFTTLETMTNARTARAWSLTRFGGDEKSVAKHFVAVSTNAAEVAKFGIDTANMFGFWDWVGGRYSMDSAIRPFDDAGRRAGSLPGAVGRLPRDGRALPHRSVRAQPARPDGLSGPLHNDFFGAQTVAVLPYDQYLKRFPAYLQQFDDGEQRQARHARRDARQLCDRPRVLGRAGNQRATFLLPTDPPGDQARSCDFIAFGQSLNQLGRHHDMLLANVFAQGEALAFGKTPEQ